MGTMDSEALQKAASAAPAEAPEDPKALQEKASDASAEEAPEDLKVLRNEAAEAPEDLMSVHPGDGIPQTVSRLPPEVQAPVKDGEFPLRLIPCANGGGLTCVEWHVQCVLRKWKSWRELPMLSPRFSVDDATDIRLMLYPGAAWAAKQAELGRKPWAGKPPPEGFGWCRNGVLRLKPVSFRGTKTLRYFIEAGDQVQGPIHCDFEESGAPPCHIQWNWLEQMDHKTDSLRLRLHFI
mmetsp:Transcript_55437/g.164820  ORF Transcript_55437/g.164820 Transcript_55437/m.164820 type:complete len:237 (+) Transcript_55437:70-780(+)